MSYTNDLREMAKKVFDPSLLMKIMNNYQEYELGEYDGDWGRADYIMTNLRNLLTAEEWDRLVKLQAVSANRVPDLLEFGFVWGLYTGFQHYFCRRPIEDPFFELIALKYNTPSALDRYPKLKTAAKNFSAQYGELERILKKPAAGTYLSKLVAAWCSQDTDILRAMFQMGYRAAIRILNDTEDTWAVDTICHKLPDWDIELDLPGILTPGT